MRVCGLFVLALLLVCCSSSLVVSAQPSPTPSLADFRVVGYLGSWIADYRTVNFSQVTHINYCALTPFGNGSFTPLSNATQLQGIVSEAHALGVKVIITVGTGPEMDNLTANATARGIFMENIVNFCQEFQLDGVDVDYEFPTYGVSAYDFIIFMQELSSALHKVGLTLSAAVAAYGQEAESTFPGVIDSLDYVNVMDYDNTDGIDQSSFDSMQTCISYWNGLHGVPLNKLMMGVPFYADNSAQPNVQPSFRDLLQMGASPYLDTFNGTMGYNGLPTMGNKTEWLIQKGLGGVMIWELSLDNPAPYSLLQRIDDVRRELLPRVTKEKHVIVSSEQAEEKTRVSESNLTPNAPVSLY